MTQEAARAGRSWTINLKVRSALEPQPLAQAVVRDSPIGCLTRSIAQRSRTSQFYQGPGP